ncbi:MAG: hypothetical protein CMJ81_07130 [Planctomycetaceae bacterium]|nr:hypothetical protein [Planctomycetaceae bacterium]MBP61241.1 hypothetical protein [Planctomycetaceae bacterium]
MNNFQVVAIIGLTLLSGATVVAHLRHWMRRGACFFWCGLWIAVGGACLWPNKMSSLAHFLGIGRGADLVSYCGVVAMLVGFWMVYIRLLRLRREVTLMVRRLAILEAQRTYESRGHSQDDRVEPKDEPIS